MYKIVPDANILLSAFISPRGATRKIVDLALAKRVVLYGSEETYEKFKEKIRLRRIKKHLDAQYFSADKIGMDYRTFVTTIDTSPYNNLVDISGDPEDDEYIRIALATDSKLIVSRDSDLLDLIKYENIRIVKPESFLKAWYPLNGDKLF